MVTSVEINGGFKCKQQSDYFETLQQCYSMKYRSILEEILITYHSARKTTITSLLNENVNPLHVQQISGHKKLESLNQYNTASMTTQK